MATSLNSKLVSRALSYDNGCDLYTDCFTCPLPVCFMEKPLPEQLKQKNLDLDARLLLQLYNNHEYKLISRYLTNFVNLTRVNRDETFKTPVF